MTDKTEKRKINRNDVISNKLLLVLICSFSGMFTLLYLDKSLTRLSTMFITISVINILMYVFAAAAVLFAVFSIAADREKYEDRTITPYLLFAFSFVLALSCFAINFMYVDAIKLLYVVVPALTVLYLIFHIYQRRFFTSALITLFSGFSCWAIYKLIDTSSYLKPVITAIASGALILAFAAVIKFLFEKNEGSLMIFGKKVRLLDKGSNIVVYISCAVSIVGIIVSVLLGTTVSLYATFSLLGYLGALLIIYTVKLM